ncbi:Na+/H+ antiporter NhaA [Curtobacterium ammoniigenes]|uniref:Na+/H+ antiporter NhaA n=1 Tax=Curtobacterium ammoniigenes TaxID=395387 RepID=UPI00082FD678|nr:Na+/H+ antiporter NhaA [Curtobacterium ammoniigenes]
MNAIVRSERFSAVALLTAAILGLAAANSPLASALAAALHWHPPLGALGLDLSIAHWVSDGLLAIFFLLVAIELKHELVAGELANVHRAAVPAIAAVGGVVVPAALYLALTNGSGLEQGWPVPTATDIAFALGILAIFGRGLPQNLRVFLLALAVLDDLIAIIIIAVVFAHGTDFIALGGAAIALAAFWVVARVTVSRRLARSIRIAALIVLGVGAWWLVYQSGVHATIAGVALGLLLPRDAGHRVYERLDPWSNVVVLPVFAFAAATVPIPSVGLPDLSPAFWAIVVALPVGKVLGITLFGGVAGRFLGRSAGSRLPFWSLVTVGTLGGVGFTVSLLMNELAFTSNAEIVDQGTLAVLVGSGVSMIAGAGAVALRAAAQRRQPLPAPELRTPQ